ncbi:transglycosylase SLT domain-containing protein [Porticoccus litoralis]|uniref:Transglycosylase SLT domain-containing protein n=1 Tax=Porticoccus litoralis TaxID=434086 RepID=A0AAW8B1Z8_9GAMM|nr:transglycosylase SLT domain-containing protein [Porticoccus litoralis]MDP1520545.1 transglycosylase SLT domain-containing protein [Porticoccus litoralis]
MRKKLCKGLIIGWLTAILFTPFATLAEQEVDQQLVALLKATIAQADSFEDRFDAEVWLMAKSSQLEKFIPDSRERLELLRKIHLAATRAGLSPEIVLAVIQIESRFDPYAVSRAGAQGLMQVMPFWKREIGREEDNLIHVDTNLRYGCTILKYYLDMEDGDLTPALARYNGSYGKTWYSELVLVAWDNWR